MSCPVRQTSEQADALARVILDWLYERNGAELAPAFDGMRVSDARPMRQELEMILEHGCRPPNWVGRKA